MSPWHPIRFAALAALIAMSGCASTQVDITGTALKEPLCKVGGASVATVIFWGTQWRADQKEPQRREAAALKGIQDFVAQTRCLTVFGIHRLPPGSAVASDNDLIRWTTPPWELPERVIHILVRELGPHITVGTAEIIEGGTEVLIDVRVLNPRVPEVLASVRTHWRNGGAFVIKGVGSLDQDMRFALEAAVMPGAISR